MLKLPIIFLGIFLFILFHAASPIALAADSPSKARPFGDFEVGLPGIPAGSSIDRFVGQDKPILAFINLAVNIVIAVLVIIGLITIVIAGYTYMTAAGDASQVKTAKGMIQAALFGILLSLVSVVILNTINKYIGSGAEEPKLGSPSNGTGTSGPGSGNGSGTGTGNTSGNGGLPSSGGNTGGNTNGGNTVPNTNTTKFTSLSSGSSIQPSTPETMTVIIDDKNYYIRDSSGFDHPSSLEGVMNEFNATPDRGDGLRMRVYQTNSARSGDLQNALFSTTDRPSSQIYWSDEPVGYK